MDEKKFRFQAKNLQLFADEPNAGGNPTPQPSPEPQPNPGNEPKPSANKTFTQDELNDVVVKRLGKQEASWLKKLGVQNADEVQSIVDNANAYKELSAKYDEAMKELNDFKTEKANAVYKDVIKKHSDEVDYIMQKVTPNEGETAEDYEKRVNEFLEEHKAFAKTDSSVRINSGVDLGGKGKATGKANWNEALTEALFK